VKTNTLSTGYLQGCRNHERRWRDHNVDKNLKDDWLERLNNLKTLELVSICEGHPSAKRFSVKGLPHISLILQYSYIERLIHDWYSYQPRIEETINNTAFHPLTSPVFELWLRHVKNDGTTYYRECVMLRLNPPYGSRSRLVELDRAEWFTVNVEAIEDFDEFLYELLVIG
jgi:hypothetical protein